MLTPIPRWDSGRPNSKKNENTKATHDDGYTIPHGK